MTERHYCEKCLFVESTEQMMVYNVSLGKKERANSKPSFVGFFTMPDFYGHCAFYIFKCRQCDSLVLDYPHGYTNFGLLFLRCSVCKSTMPLSPRKYRIVYDREGGPVPKETAEERKVQLRESVNQFDRRVIYPGLNSQKSFFALLRDLFRKKT